MALNDQKLHPVQIVHQSVHYAGFQVRVCLSKIVPKILCFFYIALNLKRVSAQGLGVGFYELGAKALV